MCSLKNFQFYLIDWLLFFCVINSAESVSDKWCRSWARFNGVIVIHSFWLANTIHTNIQDKITNGETANLLKASISDFMMHKGGFKLTLHLHEKMQPPSFISVIAVGVPNAKGSAKITWSSRKKKRFDVARRAAKQMYVSTCSLLITL